MNRQFTFYRRIKTDRPPDVVFTAVEQALRITVGGTITRNANCFHILNGTNNLNFAFIADVSAQVTLTQPAPQIIDMHGMITLKPNAFFWIMGITGLFCLWFLWGFNILFFVMDPRANYQTALDRVDLGLDGVPPIQPYGT
jgi:hypothetical protein